MLCITCWSRQSESEREQRHVNTVGAIKVKENEDLRGRSEREGGRSEREGGLRGREGGLRGREV